MPARKRTASQTRWLKEHFDDPFVKEAHKRGLRSRASFKLEELQKKDRLIKFGNIVVDLGAAPGGWSEFAVKCVGEKGRIIACDILPIRPIRGVEFLQGDFRDNEVFKQLYSMIGEGADVVLSDPSCAQSRWYLCRQSLYRHRFSRVFSRAQKGFHHSTCAQARGFA